MAYWINLYNAVTVQVVLSEYREYVNHPRGAELLDESFGVVSSIYYWYHEDFGNSDAGVLEHLRKYAEGELAEQLQDFDGSLLGGHPKAAISGHLKTGHYG